MTSDLSGLNEAQKKAVLHKEGPLLILAGAGAGKTRTITTRIVELIKDGVAPEAILAITFTNKAAKEMRERLEAMIEKDNEINRPINLRERAFVSTFHSLGVHILRENSRLLNISRHFSIFDKADSKRAVRDAISEIGLDPKQFEPGRIQNIISREKGNLVTAEAYRDRAGKEYIPNIVSRVWLAYEKILEKEKSFDFDDLLLKTVTLLRKNHEVLEKYQNTWKYIHIDEYQDTNKVQYEIAQLLAHKHQNITVVGDIDQTIYTWRGANIRNLLEFEKDYPNTTVVLLEENYRSTKRILEVANRVIEKNKLRKDKRLFTGNPLGEKIGIYPAYDEADEAAFIAAKVRSLLGAGVSPKEISVLYRANFQSRAIEEAFLGTNLPYQVLGVRFFERKEIKDILSYLKAALNPDCISDFKRALNVPSRGIGKVTLVKILAGKENELPAKMKQKIGSFRELLEKIKTMALTEKPSIVIKFILKETGIEAELKADGPADEERLENVKELASLAVRYDSLPPEEGIEKLLTDAALASDQDDMIQNKDAVKIMTVHASKGLEFDYVFIAGLEENLFPHKSLKRDDLTDEAAEEERRLFYVALTRARKKLFLTYASVRTIFGSRQVNIPSEFFGDIEDTNTEEEYNPHSVGKIIYFD